MFRNLIKSLVDFFKSFFTKRTETSVSQYFRIVDNESAAMAIKNGKTEVLADGFIYRYPVTDGNTTIFYNNIQEGVNYILSAKTEDEKEARKDLYSQIIKRESQQVIDSINRHCPVT